MVYFLIGISGIAYPNYHIQKFTYDVLIAVTATTIFCTKESTKKHDLDHDFLHEGEHQKTRFFARRKALKTKLVQNRMKSINWLLQLLGKIQHIPSYTPTCGQFNGENDHKPFDVVVPYFQTNP